MAKTKFCSQACFKLANPLKGNKFRLGLSCPMRGKKHSLESIRKISESKMGQPAWNRGMKGLWLNTKFLELNKIQKGESHPRWIFDRTQLVKRQERNDYAYKDWRKQVWARDSWKCKIANQDCAGRIEAHHILGWTKYPELRYEVNNGITLCQAHHPRKRAEEAKLAPVFQEMVFAIAN